MKAYRDGFVQDGGYSEYRGRRHGNSARQVDPIKLVVCSQNHDQVGNRLLGERLTELVSFEQLKLAAAPVILSPCQPMLFMGEEYGETARFQFFISHTDPGVGRSRTARPQGRVRAVSLAAGTARPAGRSHVSAVQAESCAEAAKGTTACCATSTSGSSSCESRSRSLAFPDRQRTEVIVLESGRSDGRATLVSQRTSAHAIPLRVGTGRCYREIPAGRLGQSARLGRRRMEWTWQFAARAD